MSDLSYALRMPPQCRLKCFSQMLRLWRALAPSHKRQSLSLGGRTCSTGPIETPMPWVLAVQTCNFFQAREAETGSIHSGRLAGLHDRSLPSLPTSVWLSSPDRTEILINAIRLALACYAPCSMCDLHFRARALRRHVLKVCADRHDG